MIKFFRKIRYNLMETGKTGKYFKYAIGEIVLVVIGILIALQINNWNESRKLDRLKTEYQTRLINDLVKDTININYFISEINKSQKTIETLIESINTETYYEKLGASLNDYFERGWLIFEFIPTSNTYTSMSQTGNMNILKNSDLIDQIIQYYGYLGLVESSNNANKNWITPIDVEVAKETAAFELDPSTKKLFAHKSYIDAIKNLKSHSDLIERNAAGHYVTNETLSGNLLSLKGLTIALIGSLQKKMIKN